MTDVSDDKAPRGWVNFNTVFGLLAIVFGVVLFIITPDQVERPRLLFGQKPSGLDPDFFPRMVAVFFMIVGVWLVWRARTLREDNHMTALDGEGIMSVLFTIVRADSQFKSLQSLFDFGKANPGKVELSHSGQWGATMVPAAQLFNWAKVNVNMTPYRGGGPSLRALLAGDADVTFQFPSTILGQGDKVRTLACVLDEPTLGSPPTFASLGFPGEIGEMHRIVMAPRGVPADRLAKLREAFVALQDDKTYKRLIGRLGEDSNLMSGEDYEKVRVEQSKAYKALVKSMTSG